MKIKNGKCYIHSCKKWVQIVHELPQNAVYYKTCTNHIPEGIIGKEHRHTKKLGYFTLYHVHKVGGSNPPYGRTGAHDVYIVRERNG